MPVNYPFSGLIPFITKTPQFDTVILKYGSRVEQRLAKEANPQWTFELGYDDSDMNLFASEVDALQAFFVARKGSYEAFYLQNPEEAYRSTIWLTAHVYGAGDIVRPVTANGRSYKCTTGGTSHGSTQPTWPTTYHGTVNDNGVVWTENSYTVRFSVDSWQFDWFRVQLYQAGKVTLIEVPS